MLDAETGLTPGWLANSAIASFIAFKMLLLVTFFLISPLPLPDLPVKFDLSKSWAYKLFSTLPLSRFMAEKSASVGLTKLKAPPVLLL